MGPAAKETHYAFLATPMEPALSATLAIFWTTATVSPFLSWPTLPFIIRFAVLKDLPPPALLEEVWAVMCL